MLTAGPNASVLGQGRLVVQPAPHRPPESRKEPGSAPDEPYPWRGR
jgi:hypothetical protein